MRGAGDCERSAGSETAEHSASGCPYTASENALARELLGRLGKNMLCLADRGFYSFEAWQKAKETGADLLWRVKGNLKLDSVKDLPDGSWLAEVCHSKHDTRRQHPITVRVIDYTIEDGRQPAGPFPLITTILDHRRAPAAELAAAYAQRWEIETAFDELKTHQRGPRAVLRSKSPQLVLQEIWGHLCCHYAIRTLMFDAARNAGREPRPSVLRSRPAHLAPLHRPTGRLSPLRPQTSPTGSGTTPSASSSPGSSRTAGPEPTPRVIKRKYTRWHVKRARHRQWPQPDRPPHQAIQISN
ncbi:IS4 family transposase [Iamia sp.]|uniref:IS4 family transposase n=1 Tax=Iamia sp. TaxID=2722710 RepID=UPI0039C8749D